MARVEFGTGPSGGFGVALDSQGRILVAGYYGYSGQDGTGPDMAVARFNPDGTLDLSFDSDGLKTIDFNQGSDVAYGIAVDSLDRVVLAGSTGGDFSVVRLTVSGAFDFDFNPSFDELGNVIDGGKQTIDFDGGSDGAWSVAVDSDNRVLIGGSTYNYDLNNNDFAVARLNTDGGLDESFSGDGKQMIDFSTLDKPNRSDRASNIVIDSAGRVLIVGDSHPYSGYDYAVTRLTTDGELDPSFAGDGKQLINDRGDDYGGNIAVDAFDRVLIAGNSVQGSTSYDFTVMRLDTTGELDTNFGTSGKQVIDFNGAWERIPGIAIDDTGRVLVAGYSQQRRPTNNDFAIARLTPAGLIDTSFGTDGKVLTDVGVPGTFETGHDIVAYQADGKMVVVASFGQYNKHIGVLRYNNDGSLDQSFGTKGVQRISFGDSDYPQSIAIDSQDRIVIGGFSWFRYTGPNTRDDYSVIRLTPTGELDTTFNGTGTFALDFNTPTDRAYSMVIDSDDRILLGGSRGVIRVGTNGELDLTFGVDGISTASPVWSGGMAIDSMGGILLTGGDFGIARLTPFGELDTNYGVDGLQTIDVEGRYKAIYDLVIDDQNRAVVVGYAGASSSDQDFVVMRLDTDGTLDDSFNSGTPLRVDFSGGRDNAYSVAIDGNGRIVVGGTTDSLFETGYDFGVIRINSDGSLDSSFDTDGKQTIDFGNSYDRVYALTVDSSNRVVLMGYSEQGGVLGREIALTRLLSNEAPVAIEDTLTIDENTFASINVITNDTDADAGDNPSNFKLVSIGPPSMTGLPNWSTSTYGSPSPGVIEFNPMTDFDQLNTGETATVKIPYTMKDNEGATSTSQLVITYTGSNDTPVDIEDTLTIDENTFASVNVLTNDTDADAGDNPSNFTLVSIGPPSMTGLPSWSTSTYGSPSPGVIEFNPMTDFDQLYTGETATVTIPYTMKDDEGATSTSQLIITYTGSNDAPAVSANDSAWVCVTVKQKNNKFRVKKLRIRDLL